MNSDVGAEAERERNLEAARRLLEAFDRGDLETVLSVLDPEIEIFLPADLPNSGTFHGHEGYLKWIQAWLEAWEDYRLEAKELRAVGDHHVLTVGRQSARGKGSGLPIEMTIYMIAEYRDAKIIRLQMYADEQSALDAAGHGG